ncbi:DNA translocase FtsK [Alkalihalobacillus sp. LMS6]|uniref:FtsK/SpoIIIE domain-containing protein n=1 Tax=Alkalihalobacillus sp. LMS6 TaxID=2924034 RepID=UPI0020D0B269|nr:FtsK/SpoIIIE domain-containing protein [Alkalihalobacillus sp. LMS6]UTR05129.1 DNA translocase FtsK [Alkalihalobacillus sp. LMS6]
MFTRKQIATRKLNKTFRAGGLHLTYRNGQTTQIIMPKIHAVDILEAGVRYVFTVPLGLNPADVENKRWLFEAQFGEHVELTRDNKTFKLSVYSADLPASLTYNYTDIASSAANHRLPIVCGVGRAGKYVSYDMTEHPHLLIAGTTGSGKSTQLRAVLTTLIATQNPTDLTLYLADLKRSEFHAFKRIEHVATVCTTIDALAGVLDELDAELKRRGDLLDRHEETHTHDLPAEVRPPNIVLCIDEVVLLKNERDLMRVVEDISSIGRALGVFLILSMQRGDAKVLDGKLKNNLTVRMGFRHTDRLNANITGTPGAESISRGTPGRLLLKLDDLTELQSPYLTLPKARELLAPHKREVEPEEVRAATEVKAVEPATPLSIFDVLDGGTGDEET